MPAPAFRAYVCAPLALSLLSLLACAHAPTRMAPTPSPALWDTLPTGATVRIHAGTHYHVGPIHRVTPDSLYLGGRDSLALPREAIDSLWQRNPHHSESAVAGLIFGSAFAVALILTDRSGGDDPGLASSIGVVGGLGIVLLGALVSSLDPVWELLYATSSQ